MNDEQQAATATTLCDVAEYGAIGDGETLDTVALQAAIDACPTGGIVLVGPGRYVTGSLKLHSHMELRLAAGAELLGSTKLTDYAPDNQVCMEAPSFSKSLLYAERAQGITITGAGCINGRGTRTHFPSRTADGQRAERPMLIRLIECQDVFFEQVTLRDAGSWCTHLVSCDDVVIRGVTIASHVNTNNDGVDLDGCRHVLIEDCSIDSGDDSLCLKSTTLRACEHVVVRHCRAKSCTAAFKCGTSSRGGFRDISVSDCDFSGSRMGCIKLLVVDGGVMEDIRISNIVMHEVEGPLFIRLGNRGRQYDIPTEQIQAREVDPEGAPPGSLRSIHLSHIQATVTGDDKNRQGIMISGIPGHLVEDVQLSDISITYPGGGTAQDATRVVPEDIARYPEQFFFGVLPAWGAYIRHARGITLTKVTMQTRTADQRPQFVVINGEDISR